MTEGEDAVEQINTDTKCHSGNLYKTFVIGLFDFVINREPVPDHDGLRLTPPLIRDEHSDMIAVSMRWHARDAHCSSKNVIFHRSPTTWCMSPKRNLHPSWVNVQNVPLCVSLRFFALLAFECTHSMFVVLDIHPLLVWKTAPWGV